MNASRTAHPTNSLLACAVWASSLLAIAGCLTQSNQPTVVVYTALDREFSAPVFQRFEQQTGIRVLAKYDVESTKTVGLVNAILQEDKRPRCDVFWNNEVLHTVRLEQAGRLARYDSPAGRHFPAAYRSPDQTWYGFAARVRVLLVNRDLVPVDQYPDSIQDLVDPQWQGRVGVAKPLFGTTATHAAVLFSRWGEQEARHWFMQLRDNAQVLSGNKQVARAVARGRLAFGLTDTDDAILEVDAGMPVEIVYPDQHQDGLGALLIPNSVAVIRDGPHPDAAHQLLDFLLGPQVETALAAGPSAQFPVSSRVTAISRAAPSEPLRAMQVDFAAAADTWESAAKFLRENFTSD